ncbi:hypothetical protein GW17_00033626 [Ensete ventricosum]|nr:hypothetical protein GW17_00033626 [Ensete ventricosum]
MALLVEVVASADGFSVGGELGLGLPEEERQSRDHCPGVPHSKHLVGAAAASSLPLPLHLPRSLRRSSSYMARTSDGNLEGRFGTDADISGEQNPRGKLLGCSEIRL